MTIRLAGGRGRWSPAAAVRQAGAGVAGLVRKTHLWTSGGGTECHKPAAAPVRQTLPSECVPAVSIAVSLERYDDACTCTAAARSHLSLNLLLLRTCSLGAAMALEQLAEPLGRQHELADAHLLEVRLSDLLMREVLHVSESYRVVLQNFLCLKHSTR